MRKQLLKDDTPKVANLTNKKKITKKVALQLLDKWSYRYNKKRY